MVKKFKFSDFIHVLSNNGTPNDATMFKDDHRNRSMRIPCDIHREQLAPTDHPAKLDFIQTIFSPLEPVLLANLRTQFADFPNLRCVRFTRVFKPRPPDAVYCTDEQEIHIVPRAT